MRFEDGVHPSGRLEVRSGRGADPGARRTSRASRSSRLGWLPPGGRRLVAVTAGLIGFGLLGPAAAGELGLGQGGPAATGELEPPTLASLAPPDGWALWRNGRPVPSQPSPLGAALEVTDVLEAGAHTWVGVLFPPSVLAYLGPGTRMTVQDLRPQSDGVLFSALRVAGEVFRAVIDPLLGSQTLRIDTGNVTAVTREADLLVIETPEGGREVRVFDGRLEVSGPDGRRVTVGAGQWVLAGPDGRLSPVMEMGPERERLDRRFRPPEGTAVREVPALPEGLPRPAEDLPREPEAPTGGWDRGSEGGDVGGEGGTGAPPLPPIAGESVIKVVK